jgi:hypothetical protein
MGRFLSPDNDDDQSDPGDPQNLNLYSYVIGNPLTSTDPSGHDCVSQSRTSDTTVSVTVARGGSPGGCGGGTYVPGTVDVDSIKTGADGHSIDIGYTPYSDTSAGAVMNVGAASGAPKNDYVIPGDLGLSLFVGLRATGVVADLFTAGKFWAGSNAAASAPAGPAVATVGVRIAGYIYRTFQTTAGPVKVLFKVTPEGETAVVSDMNVFPTDTSGEISNQMTLNVGTGQMKQVFRGIMRDLKEQGYTAIRVEPQFRMGGANAGGFTKEFTIKIR